MNWRDLFQNSVEVLLTSADIRAALQTMSDRGINAREICFVDPLHLRFTISSRSLSTLSKMCEKRGDAVEILHRHGISQILFRARKRPVLLFGLLVLFALSSWLPTRVLFVQVEGNLFIPSKQIIQQAERCGIRFGASRRAVRNDQVKNTLLSALPQLQWAGVNTYGCTAVISVRERNAEAQTAPDQTICSIIARQDAYIRQMTVVSGNPLCKVGQAVKKGQVLVSAYTDCGLCLRLTSAQAEIFGDTQRQITVLCPTTYWERSEITSRSKKYSLIIGKKRINFYKGSGISGTTCAKIYEEKYVTLPGGYILPIGLVKEEVIEYQSQRIDFAPEESTLAAFAQQYLLSLMQAGRILEADHTFSYESQFCRLDGSFSCFEMIGITRPEEGIEKNE